MRNGGPAIDTSTATATVAANTWACVEVAFTFGATPQVQLWIDGIEVITFAADTPSPTYEELSVGVVRGDQLGFHVFVDDVVVANQRIGC